MKSLTALYNAAEKAVAQKDFDHARECLEEIQERSASDRWQKKAAELLDKIERTFDIRYFARAYYGKGYPTHVYLGALEGMLGMSHDGVRKYWYYRRNVSAPAEKLMREKLDDKRRRRELRRKGEHDPVLMAKLVRGPNLPAEAFENEPGDRIDEAYRNATEKEIEDIIDRFERQLAGDPDPWDGWVRPGGGS